MPEHPVSSPSDAAGSYLTSRDAAGALVIRFLGRLAADNASSIIRELDGLLAAERPAILIADLGELRQIDDFGVVALVGLKKAMGAWQGRFELQNVEAGVSEILAMHRFVSLGQESGAARRRSADIFSRLGARTITALQEARYMLQFLGDTCVSSWHVIRHPRVLRLGDTLTNMQRVGVDALPIVGLISFLLGLIMAFMSAVQLQQFGANIYVASLVSLSMTRELGPIMTAIIVAGRSGSAFAAEIGSMKISEEIDALTTMGFDSHIFLVLPRLVAAVLVVPFLTLFSDLFAIAGGLLVGITMLDLTVNNYIDQTLATLDLFDVALGFFKGAVFAALIAWTGCLRGFQVEGGAVGVGRATTSAVVSSIFLIILSDSIVVVILRYWEW